MQTTAMPLKRNSFRPHTLDGLAGCPWLLSGSGSSPAATRGSAIDSWLRAFFTGGSRTVDPIDQAPFEYAASKTLEFSKGYPVLCDKTRCKVKIPGFSRPGECDAVIPGALCSIDWKSGRERTYYRQQAAYSLGQMEARFCDHWTAAVIFYDQEVTEFHRFERAQAQQIIERARLNYDTPGEPTPCEYCAWCENFYQCPKQLQLAEKSLRLAADSLPWAEIVADPERLGEFLRGTHALQKFDKEGRKIALEYFFQKRDVPGFRLSRGRRTWSLPVETLLLLLSKCPDPPSALSIAVQLAGDISKEHYQAICEKLSLTIDPGLLRESRGEPFVSKK